MKAVVGHHAGVELQGDIDARNIAARGRPLRQCAVVAPRIGPRHPAQRLRQARKLVHRRQRRKHHVSHPQCIAQPIGQRFARGHGTVRGNLVDHIVHASHDHCNVEMRQGFALQQVQRLRGGQTRPREQPPGHARCALLRHQPGQLPRQSLPLGSRANASG